MKQVPKEIIVVEGRDDTKRLIEVYGPNIKTIETNGSAVSRKVIQQLIALANQFEIIVFTDPDFQGERIRRIVTAAVPNAKQAYLSQGQAHSKHEGKSLGVEHASDLAIRNAIAMVSGAHESKDIQQIPMSQLMSLKLMGHPNAKEYRQQVAQAFHLGYFNAKQLQKKLQQYEISYEELEAFMKEVMTNGA